ncbi:MAG: hypothetical protein WCK05_15995 [Planctomycetota bacterium]|jgi:hypothetical protein
MNDRERFLATMRFGKPDRIPYWECAFWPDVSLENYQYYLGLSHKIAEGR